MWEGEGQMKKEGEGMGRRADDRETESGGRERGGWKETVREEIERAID